VTSTLLVVDAGSSSVKLGAYDLRKSLSRIARANVEIPAEQRSAAFDAMLRSFLEKNAIADVRAVAHRIVHGGASFSGPSVLDDTTERALFGLTALAPLHLPIALDWVARARAILGDSVPQIAVFDTTFFAALPAVARFYAIPLDLQKAHGVRRFGFHGLAHESMLRRVQHLRPDLDRGGQGRVQRDHRGDTCQQSAAGEPAPDHQDADRDAEQHVRDQVGQRHQPSAGRVVQARQRRIHRVRNFRVR